jgi:hypothetical protein
MIVRDVTNLKPEELLDAICTEIRVLSLNMRAACELLLTGEHALLSGEQKELVTLINRGALGLEELEQLILDYLRHIHFLPPPDLSEVQSASQPDDKL